MASLAYVASAGVGDRASGEPVTASTVFRIVSMTKTFTSIAIFEVPR
jgi:CubicO group peptidase (beta-lactamase class C family)